MKIVAVLLAGGVGNRFGADRPKQFFEIAGRTILEYSVDAFQRNENIHEIAIVSHPNHVSDVRQLIASNSSWTKVNSVLEGGKERYDSSLAAIRAYSDAPDTALLIHDSVRPLVSQRIIDEMCQALNVADVVNLVIPTVDTIVEVENNQMVAAPKRERLMRVQTPQAFKLHTIAEAYRRALNDPLFSATDDCGVVFRYMPEVPIKIVLGDERNVKLTHPADLPLFERLLNEEPQH
ncbi:MAG: 2-C-methyl-D-erythritol 4-phosphate cytidylyltransferase [Bacteroidaceae bacterium]|jgi:2-C-methyl-D-erythritol 4-phosphate cytidylyltransferase|nr:2-C-methyl-D-erythritol 4-phosphate cytidylyltransferase [Bacteroidaceae bacterium]